MEKEKDNLSLDGVLEELKQAREQEAAWRLRASSEPLHGSAVSMLLEHNGKVYACYEAKLCKRDNPTDLQKLQERTKLMEAHMSLGGALMQYAIDVRKLSIRADSLIESMTGEWSAQAENAKAVRRLAESLSDRVWVIRDFAIACEALNSH